MDYGKITSDENLLFVSKGKPDIKAWHDIKDKLKLFIDQKTSNMKEAMNKQYEGSKDW